MIGEEGICEEGRLPACLPACLPANLPACLPSSLSDKPHELQMSLTNFVSFPAQFLVVMLGSCNWEIGRTWEREAPHEWGMHGAVPPLVKGCRLSLALQQPSHTRMHQFVSRTAGTPLCLHSLSTGVLHAHFSLCAHRQALRHIHY